MNYRFDKIAFNSTAKKTPTESDKEHYIGLEHIDSECLEITRWGSNVAPIGEKLIMKKGDVLFGKRRAYQRKLAIAPFDGIFSAHGMVLRPNEEVVDKNYFPFFMSSDLFMERAVQISVGGLSPTINWKDLREQEFPLPSLAEQKVLSDKLWAAYRLKESYKKLLAATEEMVKSQFIEMFGDPVSWQTDTSLPTLNDTVNVISGFPFDSEKFDTEGVGTPLIRIRDIQRGYSETFTTEVFDEQYRIKKYELLVGMDGMFDIARWQSDEAALNQRVCCLRMKGSENDTFIQYLVQPILKHIENGTNATTVKHISTKQINGIRVPIASYEQKNKFAMIANQADKSGFELRESIKSIDKVIKSLINII